MLMLINNLNISMSILFVAISEKININEIYNASQPI